MYVCELSEEKVSWFGGARATIYDRAMTLPNKRACCDLVP
jgi:hypothetical protein